MIRSWILYGALFWALTGLAERSVWPAAFSTVPDPRPPAPRKERPNIVLVLTDDLGWADLGCYGHPFHETPNLDALARSGLRFTQAYAAAPVCSPTRASLLTGKYPARLGITDFIPGRNARTDIVLNDPLNTPNILPRLPLEAVTLAEVLRARGYATAHVGKWHLSEDTAHYPHQQGFMRTVGVAPAGSPPGYFYPYKSYFTLEDLRKDGQPGEYLTDRLTDETLRILDDWKERSGHERPFFLNVAHYAPHIPLQARPDLLAKYQAKAQTVSADIARRYVINPHYAAMLESLDTSVGRIIERLKTLRLYDNTIFIFLSDNGGLNVAEGPHTPATTNYPLRSGKGFLSEGGLRVPLLIHGPSTPAGQVATLPVTTVDIWPTLTALTGQQLPGDGQSFAPLLMGKALRSRSAMYWHYPHYSNQGGRPSGAIRAGKYKLIENFEDGRLALYNLQNDPGETRSLTAERPALARQLHQQLQRWRRSVGAKMPTPNPAYRP